MVSCFKYLGVWFDDKLKGNMHLEKMVERAEEWAGKLQWMSKVDGVMNVERGGLIWELLARPAFEHAAEGGGRREK